MGISSTSTKELAKLGANIEITGNCGHSSTSVKDIIKIVVAKGKHITVSAEKYSSTSLKEMVKLGGNNITIKI